MRLRGKVRIEQISSSNSSNTEEYSSNSDSRITTNSDSNPNSGFWIPEDASLFTKASKTPSSLTVPSFDRDSEPAKSSSSQSGSTMTIPVTSKTTTSKSPIDSETDSTDKATTATIFPSTSLVFQSPTTTTAASTFTAAANNYSTTSSSYWAGFSPRGILVLSCLLGALAVVFFILVLRVIFQRKRQHEQRTNTTSRKKTCTEVSKKRIERRYQTVEGWLISKRVLQHDDQCQACLALATINGGINRVISDKNISCSDCTVGGESHAMSISSSTTDLVSNVVHRNSNRNTNSDDNNVNDASSVHHHHKDLDSELDCTEFDSSNNECSICMENMAVSDIVSWSAHSSCQHVFHHECIKEWLLKRTRCPICREYFLPVDTYQRRQQQLSRNNSNKSVNSIILGKQSYMDEWMRTHSQRNTTTFYCNKDGLVTVPLQVRCTRRELAWLQARICGSLVKRSKLAKIRGERKVAFNDNLQIVRQECNDQDNSSSNLDDNLEANNNECYSNDDEEMGLEQVEPNFLQRPPDQHADPQSTIKENCDDVVDDQTIDHSLSISSSSSVSTIDNI